jgi:hypothetical protein
LFGEGAKSTGFLFIAIQLVDHTDFLIFIRTIIRDFLHQAGIHMIETARRSKNKTVEGFNLKGLFRIFPCIAIPRIVENFRAL